MTTDAAYIRQRTSPAGDQGLAMPDQDIDDDGSDVMLLRVMSDIRRAYCRQPLTGTGIDGVSGKVLHI